MGLGIEKLNLDLESGAISGKGVFEQFTPFFCAAARPKLCKRTAQIVLGHGPRLRRFSTLIEGKRPLTNLRCFFQLQVALRRFDRYALLYKEPCEGVSRIGPVRLQGEDVGEEAVGLGGLVAVGLELGALEQGEEIGPVLLAGGGGAGLHFLQDTGSLGGDVGEGLIHAFLCENAGHFIKDLWTGGTLDLGEGSGQFIDAGEASGIGLLGGLAKALSFLPALGLLRIGEGGLVECVRRTQATGRGFSLS